MSDKLAYECLFYIPVFVMEDTIRMPFNDLRATRHVTQHCAYACLIVQQGEARQVVQQQPTLRGHSGGR